MHFIIAFTCGKYRFWSHSNGQFSHSHLPPFSISDAPLASNGSGGLDVWKSESLERPRSVTR